MNPVKELTKLGQSIWLDNINRQLLTSGRLQQMIDLGLLGMTSNPTIFDQAISKSSDYDELIKKLAAKSIFEIYDELTIKNVQEAADIFQRVYERTNGQDGYISLEVNPHLAFAAEKTVSEAQRLYTKVNRPNVMFKVPATGPGLQAVKTLIAEGININVTLIFSLGQYIQAAQAFIGGLSEFTQRGGGIAKVASVASVFVSRIDTLADKMIEEKIKAGANHRLEKYKGKAAVANCKLIYEKFQQIFKAEASLQRVLWASTSTKNPAYSDIKYVTELIGKDTVNTVPDNTWEAFLDHGIASETVSKDLEEAHQVIKDLRNFGIDLDIVCQKLLENGVKAFEGSFDSLLLAIEKKSQPSRHLFSGDH